ncbi:MAG TPA: aldehyde dehydrogenase family protein, partial [Leptospiraceae bacterium]|nr:aldehyde dehydrogenase family protein [Leptospiraceae bacterium]
KRAKRVARQIRSGNLNINDVYVNYFMSDLPFGGVKSSGIGRVYAIEGLRAFADQQSVCYDRLGLNKDPYWFPYTPAKQGLIYRATKLLFG